MKSFQIILGLLAVCGTARAELSVSVAAPKATGNKVLVKLEMENTFTNTIQSARAEVFLFDGEGKVMGRSSRWVIGGSLRKPVPANPPLPPQGKETFNFVVTTSKPVYSTNLTAKVTFSRVILDGGKLANPVTDVEIQPN